MKSRQISLALFIKFDNRYRPPEGQKHSATCHLEGGREYGRDPSNTSSQSFSQSDVRRPYRSTNTVIYVFDSVFYCLLYLNSAEMLLLNS